MKKAYVFSILLQILCIAIHGQSDPVSLNVSTKRRSSLASFDLHLPVGVFARSQFVGAGLNYSWSHQRYGRGISTRKMAGFTFNTGADYFLGKKIKVAGYDFRYGGYVYLHVMPGVLFNPWANANIAFTAGPTLGIYKGNADAGFGVNLFGAYFFKKNISIGPGITYKKHSKADALWSGSVRVSYGF
jgi:hypothetical protein